MYRTISVKLASREELEHFLELLPRYVGVEYYAIVRGTNVYIQLSGSPAEIKKAVAAVKTIAGIAKARLKPVRSYPLEIIFKESEVQSPIPPDVLADYLAARGFKARLRGGELQTDADLEHVKKAVAELSAAYKTLEEAAASPHAKRIAAIYIALTGSKPHEALERLAESGILNKGQIYSLAVDLQTAKRRMRALVGKK